MVVYKKNHDHINKMYNINRKQVMREVTNQKCFIEGIPVKFSFVLIRCNLFIVVNGMTYSNLILLLYGEIPIIIILIIIVIIK